MPDLAEAVAELEAQLAAYREFTKSCLVWDGGCALLEVHGGGKCTVAASILKEAQKWGIEKLP